jgi:ABC-2 type transport system ATP-binding protein
MARTVLSNAPMTVVRTSQLRKSYGSTEVLCGIDLVVPKGSLFGFLGPNGAGKTTTMRILLGLLRASSGTPEVLGQHAWDDGPTLRKKVGYLAGDLSLYPHMTAARFLAFVDGVRGTHSRPEMNRLAAAFDLDLNVYVRNCSRGMKQKIGLIQALMHAPELLILDEPTMALDPLVRDVLHEELRDVAAQGRTVLFSSHSLDEVQRLCDWVAIVRRGHLIEQTQISELRRQAVRRVEIQFGGDGIPDVLPGDLHVSSRSEGTITGQWLGAVPVLLTWLATLDVEDAIIAPPDLDDLFLAYYAESQ